MTNLERFESLGTNCEFGFVLRAQGVTSGGFFRWTEAPVASVLTVLQQRLEGIYLYDNLVPKYSGMVLDTANGIGFHSKMQSENKRWIHSETERSALYQPEFERQSFLIERFRERAADPATVFVLKDEAGDAPVEDISTALASLGPARLLVVRAAAPGGTVGTIEEREGLAVGHIDRFAPLSDASQFSPAWLDLMSAYDRTKPA